MEVIIGALTEGIKDTVICIPILYATYLFMEILEGSSRLNEETLCRYSRKVGPALGGLLGVIPQCGLAGSAAALYSTGTVTLGTMLAVFFATSDEMLPVMLASLSGKFAIGVGTMAGILAAKAAIGIVLGYVTDIAVKAGAGKNIHALCERDRCECGEEGNVFRSALIHTLKITVMLLIVNVALSVVIQCVGIGALSGTVINQPVIGPVLVGLFGLIPNCAISVIITESYLGGVLGLGGLFAGLLANAGIGLIVLFRTNDRHRENLMIVAIMYALSVLCGIIIQLAVKL
ncbi:MAG: putative manganese transporter [Bacillota bacterium]